MYLGWFLYSCCYTVMGFHCSLGTSNVSGFVLDTAVNILEEDGGRGDWAIGGERERGKKKTEKGKRKKKIVPVQNHVVLVC